jgi:hypothetical protein
MSQAGGQTGAARRRSNGGSAYAGSIDAQHQREKFLRHLEFVTFSAIMRHEQPAGEALFQIVTTIASGGLRSLGVHGLQIPKHQGPETGLLFHGIAKGAGFHLESRAICLNEGFGKGGIDAGDKRQANHSFPSDQSDLGLRAVLQRRNYHFGVIQPLAQADGLMFWFTRNKFVGSYFRLTATSRSKFAP